MLSKELIKEKFKDFIPEDKEKFKRELAEMKDKINLAKLNTKPLLVYSQNKRNALYYILSVFYSLKNEKLLNYVISTGQTLINQHFATSAERDQAFYHEIYYSDILFLSLSQYDYTSEYLESLIIDLVEFRKEAKRLTIISYDVMSSGQQYVNLTKKLHAYFVSNEFQIIDLAMSKSTPFDKGSSVTITKTEEKNKTKKRIV